MDILSIVILNYNGKKYLEKFLPKLIKFSQGYPIIVADNASIDDSISYITTKYPEVRIIRFEENHGFATGYNLVLHKIDSKYYILLNSDVEVTENWITPLLNLMESDHNIAVCQPKILSYQSRGMFEYAGAGGGFIDYLGYPFCRGRIFNTLEEDNGQYDDTIPVFWASGACFVVRSELYHLLGGFDDEFFAHMEEIDLCWRMKKAGYGVWYCGESRVFHVGGGTLPKSDPGKTYLNFRNSLLILIKNHTVGKMLLSIFLRIILDTFAIIRFMVRDTIRDSISVIKAHIYVIWHFRSNLKKRKDNNYPNKEHIAEMYNSSIVFDYFITGKKRFSDLRISNTR